MLQALRQNIYLSYYVRDIDMELYYKKDNVPKKHGICPRIRTSQSMRL